MKRNTTALKTALLFWRRWREPKRKGAGRKQIEGVAEGSEQRFRSLVQNASDVILIMGADQTVRYVSPAVERVLGYRPEEMVGSLALDYVHSEDLEYMSKSFAQTLHKPGVHPPVEYRVRAADGSWRYMEAIRSNWLGDPHIAGVVVNVRDITERKILEEQLEHRAFYDALTDLPNRQLFVDHLGQALERTRRLPGRKKVGVLFMNVDNFKVVNDSTRPCTGSRQRARATWYSSWSYTSRP